MIDAAEELNPKEQKFISGLMSEATVLKAAASAGISETTAYRWLKRPEIAEAYRAARTEALAHATARLKALSSQFVATLESVSGDENAPASSRIAAAKTGLEFAYRADMYEDIEAMMQELKGYDDE